jgi:hypothetical protein
LSKQSAIFLNVSSTVFIFLMFELRFAAYSTVVSPFRHTPPNVFAPPGHRCA